MTIRHAAALALVGWYLMVPPLSAGGYPDDAALITSWHRREIASTPVARLIAAARGAATLCLERGKHGNAYLDRSNGNGSRQNDDDHSSGTHRCRERGSQSLEKFIAVLSSGDLGLWHVAHRSSILFTLRGAAATDWQP